ncbi:MAG: hypothetical protein R2795_15080 [Saprospiraceae bacterium]
MNYTPHYRSGGISLLWQTKGFACTSQQDGRHNMEATAQVFFLFKRFTLLLMALAASIAQPCSHIRMKPIVTLIF